MFIEMEGFIKARKRDKNDQNALIRSLSNQVTSQEKNVQYNRKAVENVATSVRRSLKFIIICSWL